MKVGTAPMFFGGKLLFGCVMFSLVKIMSQTCVPSSDGRTSETCPSGFVKFERPVFSAFVMVGSMSIALIFYYLFRHGKPGIDRPTRKLYFYVMLPALLDATCVSILMVGSVFIPMSLTMTLKGVRIVYSTILVMIIFKRKQYGYNIFGVAVAMVGVSLAALSAVLNRPDLGSSCMIGVGLVLLSEFVRSLMVVIEEYLMKRMHCDPFFLIGLQGFWGLCVLTIGLMLSWLVIPGKDAGASLENLEVTFRQISDSHSVIAILSTLPPLIAAHFMCSVMVTKLLSSVHNAMASVLMTALVWLVELFTHYVVDTKLGNAWGPYSALQLVGFGLVVLALLIYDGSIIRLPRFFFYPISDEEVDKAELQDTVVDSSTSISPNSPISQPPSIPQPQL